MPALAEARDRAESYVEKVGLATFMNNYVLNHIIGTDAARSLFVSRGLGIGSST